MNPHKSPNPDPIPTGEFARFDATVRRLFAVPKAEIDRKEAAYQKKKAARKKRKGK